MTQAMETNSKDHNFQEKPNNSKNTKYKQFILLFVLFCISIISLIFYIKQTYNEQNNQIQQKLQILSKQQTQAYTKATIKIATLSQKLDKKITKLTNELSASLQDTPYKTNDWRMQKAKYYLELASINNTWTNDNNTTKELLIRADNTLRKIQTDEITEIRKLIAEEELRVSAATELDTVKMLSQIHAISKTIHELPIIPLKNRVLSENTNYSEEEIANGTWQEHFKSSLKKLNGLIIIRRNADNTAQLFSPIYLETIREIITLNLQQMQSSILTRNQDIYNLNLHQAIENIDRTLEDQNPQKKAIIGKLKDLQNLDLSIKKAKIGSALRKLNKTIQRSQG